MIFLVSLSDSGCHFDIVEITQRSVKANHSIGAFWACIQDSQRASFLLTLSNAFHRVTQLCFQLFHGGKIILEVGR